ncbi:MAG: hypothetical protein KA712_06590 [Myxococcales bacterium]|nr:hypothetical protein [Myxococcales bacterium]
MLAFRPRTIGRSLAGLIGLMVTALSVGACGSSDERRDQFYGTDAAADYTGPDGGLFEAGATPSQADAAADGPGTPETDALGEGTSPKDTADPADDTLDAGDAAPGL